MRTWLGAILGVLVVAFVGRLAWGPVSGLYFQKRAALRERIDTLTREVHRYESGVREQSRVEDELGRLAERTLGGDLETVDHRLRSALNRIGAETALEDLVVGTGRVKRLQSPAKAMFSRRTQQALRDEIDFVEVEAWISGRGPLDRVLRLVERLDAEPWLKRVDQLRIQPRDNGDVLSVSVHLATAFMPGREPSGPTEAPDAPGLGRYASLAARNPFQVPPAPVAPPEPAPPPRPAAAAGPWMLTGVVSGPLSMEVWLLNRESGESRRLEVGASMQQLVLVAADGETAHFRVGERRFSVAIGEPVIMTP